MVQGYIESVILKINFQDAIEDFIEKYVNPILNSWKKKPQGWREVQIQPPTVLMRYCLVTMRQQIRSYREQPLNYKEG